MGFTLHQSAFGLTKSDDEVEVVMQTESEYVRQECDKWRQFSRESYARGVRGGRLDGFAMGLILGILWGSLATLMAVGP